MPVRRVALCALLMGIAGAGLASAAAAQQPITLDLRGARELVVVDAWHGFSAISPTRTTHTLRRSADGSFVGTVQISVGGGLLRRDTSFAVQLPRAAVDSLLQVLSEASLREGSYQPTFTHTDDYPTITVDVTAGDALVRFHTTSQGEAHVPWQVSAGGTTYVSDSEAVWPALSPVLLRLASREERALAEAARADPEAQCNHARISPPWLTQRPRYAAGEAWFRRDSVITVRGKDYRRYGIPRIVGLNEIRPYDTFRGVPVFEEIGPEGTPDVLYMPVRASCEVQAYDLEPRP